MKIREAEKHLRDGILSIYSESESANIAKLILEQLTGHSRSYLLLNRQELLTSEQTEILRRYVVRLQQHEPVQYILNKSWFYDMELYVDKNVLIPRPETEELVHWIVNDIERSGLDVFGHNPSEADRTRQLKILDIGTGSGCIALALKKTMPKAEVWGCDCSEEALNVARRNGAEQNIRVDFQGINFLDEKQQKMLPTVDVIVSNPPYIPLKDKETMQPNVLQYEPHTALFVPDNDALLFYKAIAIFGHHRLHEGGTIYLEIQEDLGQEVEELFKKEGYNNVTIKRDMQGKDRMVRVASP